MKTTGVVRRIDDLGRIVIPKELRRTLRIRDGESLEIFVENEMITLKKYSSMSDIKEISNNLVNTINQTILKNVIITDRDKVISASSNIKLQYLDKNISKYLEEKLNSREMVVEKNIHDIELIDGLNESLAFVISPIITNGDVVGNVVIFSDKEGITDGDVKLASIISNFLGKHIEE